MCSTFRNEHGDAYYFNWRLKIDGDFQRPFVATHAAMRELDIDEELPVHELAANLRRVFSGIVSGNVREDTAAMIESKGPSKSTDRGELWACSMICWRVSLPSIA